MKRKPYIIKEINKLQLKPNDTLVIHFDIEQFDLDDCNKMFNLIIKTLPEKINVMALLGNTKLEIIRTEE